MERVASVSTACVSAAFDMPVLHVCNFKGSSFMGGDAVSCSLYGLLQGTCHTSIIRVRQAPPP